MSQTDPRAVAKEHYGDPCVYCHTGHDDVAIGPCPRRKSDIVELAKLPNGYWGVLINKVTSFATIDLDAAHCNFQRVDEAIAQALADAERRGLERAAKIVDDEEEMPGEIPQETYDTIINGDQSLVAEALRIVVRATKKGIKQRIAQAQSDKEAPHDTDAE